MSALLLPRASATAAMPMNSSAGNSVLGDVALRGGLCVNGIVTGFDVIGDVHGCADALERLLRKLGYRRRWRTWRHPTRQAVFVGDLVDRGTQQIKTVQLVRRMVDAGSAQLVMGNHEFNAVAWATRHPITGERLRGAGADEKKYHDQHAAFLNEVRDGSRKHRDIVAWFRALPMFVDLGELRVVHACWHDESLDILRTAVDGDGLTLEFLVAAHDPLKQSREYWAIETALKGPEVPLPQAYLDKDDHLRERARIRWWDERARTLRTLAEIPPGCRTPSGDAYPELPDSPSDYAEPFRYRGDKPVVFGHYWRRQGDTVTEPRAVCVDLSAVDGGHLAAYRFDGEPTIDPAKIVSVQA
ncbi:MAG: metallophosphoesterase [Ilumatobacteraceae bacterium]